MRTVLFVCTGNTCRSPMAEAVAREALKGAAVGEVGKVFVASAGVAAIEGVSASEEALEALEKLGLDYSGRSKRLTGEMIRKADVVLCMTHAHQEAAREMVSDSPRDLAKIRPLDPESDIADPIGSPQSAYDSLAERFLDVIPRRLKEVLLNENRARRRSPR